MKTNYTKEQKETLKLVGILSVCVFVLLVLSIVFMNSLSVPTSTPTPKYIDIDNIEGMNLKDAKALLENADISYEIIPTESKIANKVEKMCYLAFTNSCELVSNGVARRVAEVNSCGTWEDDDATEDVETEEYTDGQ